MSMYELTIIRNIPPKRGNPGWVDMLHLALTPEEIDSWVEEYAEVMKDQYPHINYTIISHYEELNTPAHYRYPRAIEMEHLV